MKKSKKYTIFIASEKDENSRSFRISSRVLKIIMLFGIIISSLSIVGSLRLMGKDKLVNEINQLRAFKLQASQIIHDIESIEDSSGKFENMLSTLFSNSDSLLPTTAPIEGYVTQGLSLDKLNQHTGIDVAAPFGATIKSPADGMVVFSGKNEEMGNVIIISHKFGFFTIYSHNDTNLVNERDLISKGQVIAKVGDSGISEGPHLHFEIWKNNRVLDPRNLIEEYKKKDVSIR
mgnify:CR=1 FL=1